MRWLFPLVVTLLVCLPLGRQWWPLASTCPADPAASSDARDSCQDGHADHIEALSVDDAEIKRTLVSQATSLMDQGRTADSQTLAAQLNTNRCQLKLPEGDPGVGEAPQILAVARESVVVVSWLYKCAKCTRWHATTASGFVIGSEGVVVTNYHVVDSADNQALVVMTADQHVYPVQRVLAADRAEDLAILKVDAQGLRPLSIAADPDAAPVGSAVTVISHPDSRFYCCTSGIVSRYTRIRSQGQLVRAMAITADYARGSSGAPVLNERGQVVGVVCSTESIYYTKSAQRQNDLQMVYRTCIPVASLAKLVGPGEQIAANDAPPPP